MMNHDRLINLEMQVVNQKNWLERSLCYLARNFTQLGQREHYCKVRPVIQIGLLDYTLFPDHPEFYSTYQFLNVKNHTLYIDKLQLSVLDLTRIDLATEEDNQYFKEASETVYSLSKEEQIRQQCWVREDYYRTIRAYNKDIADLKSEISKKDQQLMEKDALIAALQAQLAEKGSKE